MLISVKTLKLQISCYTVCIYTQIKMDEESTQKNHGVINNKELELLIIATIQTKRSKKKTGNEEVFNLVQSSLEYDVSREQFDEILTTLVKDNSIKSNTVGNRVCLSLPKDQQENNMEPQANTLTSENNMKEEFYIFKEGFMEEFKELKTTLFAEVNSFKIQLLTSHEILQSIFQNSEATEMIRLREDILFLKEQIRNKDKVIDSLLCQLSKRDDIFLLQNRGSTTTKTSAVQTENIENTAEKKSSATMTSSFKRNENLLTDRRNGNLLTTINNQIKKISNTEQQGNNNNKSTNEENNENDEKRNEEDNGDSGIDPKRVNKKGFIVGDSIVKHVKGYELTQSRCMLKISLVLELDACKIMSSQLCVKILITSSYMLGRMIWQQMYQLIKWQNQLLNWQCL